MININDKINFLHSLKLLEKGCNDKHHTKKCIETIKRFKDPITSKISQPNKINPFILWMFKWFRQLKHLYFMYDSQSIRHFNNLGIMGKLIIWTFRQSGDNVDERNADFRWLAFIPFSTTKTYYRFQDIEKQI